MGEGDVRIYVQGSDSAGEHEVMVSSPVRDANGRALPCLKLGSRRMQLRPPLRSMERNFCIGYMYSLCMTASRSELPLVIVQGAKHYWFVGRLPAGCLKDNNRRSFDP